LRLVLPNLVFWVIIGPSIILYSLYRGSKNNILDKYSFRLKYGFLYNEYTNKSFYWEFVKIILKLSIIAIV